MKDIMWNELLPVLKKMQHEDLERENWDTWWGWNNQRQRTITKGSKGVKISVVGKPMRKFHAGAPLTEIVNGKERPMIRIQSFDKSFFNLKQTELKGVKLSLVS